MDNPELLSAVLSDGSQFDIHQWTEDHNRSAFQTYLLVEGKLYYEESYQVNHPIQAGDSVTLRINLLGKEADLVVHIVPSAEGNS